MCPGNFSRASEKKHALLTEYARSTEDKCEVLGAYISRLSHYGKAVMRVRES